MIYGFLFILGSIGIVFSLFFMIMTLLDPMMNSKYYFGKGHIKSKRFQRIMTLSEFFIVYLLLLGSKELCLYSYNMMVI